MSENVEKNVRLRVENRFRILVCIDGSPTSYQGLRYALKFSADHEDTDISLLHVRLKERGQKDVMRSEVTAEELINHELELPEFRSLKQARNILVERGFLGSEWTAGNFETKAHRSRPDNHGVTYKSGKTGQRITLLVRYASSMLAGILEAAMEAPYELVVVSATSEEETVSGAIDAYTAIGVATEHKGTVIVARALEEGHGHFVCLTNAVTSTPIVLKDAAIASRCGCPIHLYSVSESDETLDESVRQVDLVKQILASAGYQVSSTCVEVGDTVNRIVEHGRQHSLIVMSATEKSRLRRMFLGSVSHDVLKKAHNSVMIVR